MCPELRSLSLDSNQLAGLDISNNIELNRLNLKNMPTLNEVCVWVMPFPPEGLYDIKTSGSPNIYFTTECTAGN